MGCDSQDTLTLRIQDILHTAQGLMDLTAASISPRHSHIGTGDPPIVINLIKLPSPRPILLSLREAGFSPDGASKASQIYEQRAEQLKQRIEESILTACRKAAELPSPTSALPPDLLMKRMISISTDVYVKCLEEWKEEIIRRFKQTTETPAKSASKNSRTFNYEYIPILEHFFEENAFPTHLDKVFLAKKSNMQYRQIHVWFQNRRNRTKKEGKSLKKKPTCIEATKVLDTANEREEDCVVDFDSRATNPSQSSLKGTTETTVGRNRTSKDLSKDAFASPSPLHAFPSRYPPACHYDAFPCKSGPVHFSIPEWRRLPCLKPPSSSPISINDLVEKFSHLNVRGETRSRGPPKLQLHAATVAITVIPSRAPHPALMVRKYSPPTQTIHHYPSVRAPVSRLKTFQSPHPASKPLTLVPLSIPPNKSELLVKRKTMPLPQRFSGRRNTSRNTTPSESSSTSPSSPPLFSMDSDSRSCCSSSVSSSSTPPDIGSVQELPSLFGSPCCSAVDSPIYLGSCGAVDAIPPLSVL